MEVGRVCCRSFAPGKEFRYFHRRKDSAMTTTTLSRYEALHQEVLTATTPSTELERWFAGELVRTLWEEEGRQPSLPIRGGCC